MRPFACWVLAGVLVGCGAPRPQLNVLFWPEYIDPAVVAEFERQHGCRVVFDYYETNEAMMAKLEAGGTASYDVVSPTFYLIPSLIRRGLLAPLRHENLPNLRNLDPQFADTPFDPGNRYSVPYQWGSTGLYVREPAGVRFEETWGLIFDPAQQPGPMVLLDDYRASIDVALRYRGHQPESTNLVELAEARDLLIDAKNRSLGFAVSTSGRNRVATGEVLLAVAYSVDAVRAVAEDPATRYFLPREGTEIFVDNLCIPAGAPHRDLAEKFVNFVLEAGVGARIAQYNSAGTPNQAARELLDPAVRDNPAIYPPPEMMRRLWMSSDLGGAARLYDEVWTQVKAQ